MRPTMAFLRVVSVLLLAACASGGVPATTDLDPGGETGPRPRTRSGLRDPITAADIATINASSAYDAVVKLRGTFLQARGTNSFLQPVRSTRPVVFVDGMEIGTIFELRSIPAGDVMEIRFLTSSEATYRYGMGYMAGVIQVTTKR